MLKVETGAADTPFSRAHYENFCLAGLIHQQGGAMNRYLTALALGVCNAIDRATFAVLEHIRKELARDLNQRNKARRLEASVVKDIERL